MPVVVLSNQMRQLRRRNCVACRTAQQMKLNNMQDCSTGENHNNYEFISQPHKE